MRFQTPGLLWLALPWLVAWLRFARVQKRALAWVVGNVAERFRSRLSVHTPTTLAWHLWLLAVMGLALIVAAARPYLPGETEIEAERARVVLILDASASMFATDLAGPPPEGGWGEERPKNRFEFARDSGRRLIEAMPETSFALVSFSGSTAIHTPMSADRGFLMQAVRGLEIHGQYQTTGSSFGAALDAILEFRDESRPNLQAVILSDGEQPVEEEIGEALEALAGQGVAVHTIAIGTTEGQGRLIYDFRDIVAKREEPRVLRRYHTRRVDETLERIAEVTGGTFEVLAPGASEPRIAEAILSFEAPPARIERTGTGTDLGVWFLLVFLAGFLADGLAIGRRPDHAPLRFEVEHLGGRRPPIGRAAATVLLCLSLPLASSCSNTPRARAHRENEAGIALDALRRHEDARVHYRRSIGYGVRAEIPTFNLARSVHREGDYSEAHELYQEALTIDPKLPEAYYNDGLALFEWGEAERDPEGCELERTRELWSAALQRFARAVGLTRPTQTTGRMARGNHAALEPQLAEVERLIADPPPGCFSDGGGGGDQESEGDSGEGGEGGGGGGGGQEDESEDPSQAGGGGGGGGGDPDDPDQGGGGGGGGEPEDPGAGGGGGEPPPLSPDELDRIAQELDRIGRQGWEPGKFHRRTLPEQFGEEHWRNPDREIWW